MPNKPSILAVSDAQIKRWYDDAVKGGYAASLMRRDGYLLDMAGWLCDDMTDELHGYRWQEYIDPDHLNGLLSWIFDADAPDGNLHRGISMSPMGPIMLQYSMSKVSGPTLRLMIGVVEEVAPDAPPPLPGDAELPGTEQPLP